MDDLEFSNQNLFLQAIPPTLTDEDNKYLSRIPSSQEIKKVMFSFQGDKSPSPDGFPMFFFQSFQHIVETDICKGVK